MRRGPPSAVAWALGVPIGVLLLLLALLALADLFDRRLIAEPLARWVEQRTDRPVRIGAFDLRWGWPFAVHAQGLSLGNARWASDTAMVEVARLRVPVNPLALLRGPPYTTIHLEQPHVRVERSAQGDWNWPQLPEQPESDAPTRLPVAVRVEGGRVRYIDHGGNGGSTFIVDLDGLTVAPVSTGEAAQEIELALDGRAADLPLRAEATARLVDNGGSGALELGIGDTELELAGGLRTGSGPLQLRLRVDGPRLDAAQLAALAPAGAATPSSATRPLPRLGGIDARLDVQLAEVELSDAHLQDVVAQLSLEQALARFTLNARAGGAELRVRTRLDTAAANPVLHLQAEVPEVPLTALAESMPLSGQPGRIAGVIDARVHMPERRLPSTPAAVLSRLTVSQSRVRYAGEDGILVVRAGVAEPGGEVSAAAQLTGAAWPAASATAATAPLRSLMQPGPFRIRVRARAGQAEASLRARLLGSTDANGARIEFDARGEGLSTLDRLAALPAVPQAHFSGVLRQAPGRWTLDDFDLRYGDSRLAGRAAYASGGARPTIELTAQASLLNLAPWLAQASSEDASLPPQQDAGDAPPLPVRFAERLRNFDADLALSAERIRLDDELVLGGVRVEAQLTRGHLEVGTLAFGVAGGALHGTFSANAAAVPARAELDLQVEALQLSRLASTFMPLEEHLGRLSGRLQVEATAPEPGTQADEQLLPGLGRLTMDDTRLRFQDPQAQTDLAITVSATGANLRLVGDGRYRGEPARLVFVGAPLQTLRDPSEPYRLRAELHVAETDVTVQGTVLRPWSPQRVQADFTIDGENPVRLESVLGPLFPPLPAYAASGHLAYDGSRIRLTGIDVQVGDSDLRGQLSVDLDAARPLLQADLRSDHVDWADFEGLLDDDAPSSAEPDSIFPQEPLDMTVLNRFDVDARYRARELEASGMPVNDLSARVQLRDGHLTGEPIRLGVGGGDLRLRLDLRARESTLAGLLDLEMRRVDLARVLDDVELAANSFGVLGGQAKFWVSGDSVATLLGSADGGLMLLMTGGALDGLLVEAAGLDLGESLLAAAGLADTVPIDCAYASLHARGGNLSVDRFVVDTADTLFLVDGSVDLSEESLDLTLYPEAKDPGVPAAYSPLEITGSFSSPAVDVLSGQLALQTAGAVALGVLASPVAALLPFLSFGQADEPALCGGWIEQLREARDAGG